MSEAIITKYRRLGASSAFLAAGVPEPTAKAAVAKLTKGIAARDAKIETAKAAMLKSAGAR